MMLPRGMGPGLGDSFINPQFEVRRPEIVAAAQAALTSAGFSADCTEDWNTAIGYERMCAINGGPKIHSADALAQYGATLPQYMITQLNQEIERTRAAGQQSATDAGIYTATGPTTPGVTSGWVSPAPIPGGYTTVPLELYTNIAEPASTPGTRSIPAGEVITPLPPMNSNPPNAAGSAVPNPQPGITQGTAAPQTGVMNQYMADTTAALEQIQSAVGLPPTILGLPWWLVVGGGLAAGWFVMQRGGR